MMGVTQSGTCCRLRAAPSLSREAKHRMTTTGQTGAASSRPCNPAQGQTGKALPPPSLAAINGCAHVPRGEVAHMFYIVASTSIGRPLRVWRHSPTPHVSPPPSPPCPVATKRPHARSATESA